MLFHSVPSVARKMLCPTARSSGALRSFSSLWPESPKPSSTPRSTTPRRAPQDRQGVVIGHDDQKKSAPIIIPYSQSLPSRGHQWCDKCQIRAHAFQKPCHRVAHGMDACSALPAGTICPSAERYFRQQRNVMIGLAAVVFTVPTVVPPLMAAMSGSC